MFLDWLVAISGAGEDRRRTTTRAHHGSPGGDKWRERSKRSATVPIVRRMDEVLGERKKIDGPDPGVASLLLETAEDMSRPFSVVACLRR